MKVNLEEVFKLQNELDKHIHKEHNVSYAKIHTELKLALLVELAETANEIRSFKFWSFKKPSNKSVILEEYADGLHFITSLSIYYKVNPNFNITKLTKFKNKKEITNDFIKLFNLASKISCKVDVKKWYQLYLTFGLRLGFSLKEILKAYKTKCQINHQRQNQKY